MPGPKSTLFHSTFDFFENLVELAGVENQLVKYLMSSFCIIFTIVSEYCHFARIE